MKKIAILAALLLGGIASYAQTTVSDYTPGVSAEGVNYASMPTDTCASTTYQTRRTCSVSSRR